MEAKPKTKFWWEEPQAPLTFTYSLWFCYEWDEPDWAKQLRPVPGYEGTYTSLQEASNAYWRAVKQYGYSLHSGVGIVRDCSDGFRGQALPLDTTEKEEAPA